MNIKKKRPHRDPVPLLPCEDITKSLKPGKEPSPDHAGTLILDFQLPK